MQPVHFIWLGPVPNPSSKASAMPNAVAQACKSDNVRFWCLDAHAPGFAGTLGPRVQVKTLGHLEQKKLRIGGRWKVRALDVLQTMLRYNAFVAAKDLLNLILLHTYGGYTMDTTCSVAAPIDRAHAAVKLGVKNCSVRDAVAKSHSGPHLVRVGRDDDIVAHQYQLRSPNAIRYGWDANSNAPVVDLPQIDVWAMYSPAGHIGMETAIKAYVERCDTLGINASNIPNNTQGVSGHSILEMIADPQDLNGVRDARADRNTLIGNLISHSVIEGLLAAYGNNPATIEANTFRATLLRDADPVIDQLPQDICPELGIVKTYNGTWRV